jgi:putative phosphonate metabolism protein
MRLGEKVNKNFFRGTISMAFTRYAIYFTATGDLAARGASWLGWDVAQGCAVPHPPMSGLDLPTLTQAPRKYGFHATIKPPFHLAEGMTFQDLSHATKTLCASLAPLTLPPLKVTPLGRFLALTFQTATPELNDLAAHVVKSLDPFRAPPSAADLAKRRQANLSLHQDALLVKWGYPYVMDEFRFHMTLTGKIPKGDIPDAGKRAENYFAPALGDETHFDALSLVGQDTDGMFHLIERMPLIGQ